MLLIYKWMKKMFGIEIRDAKGSLLLNKKK